MKPTGHAAAACLDLGAPWRFVVRALPVHEAVVLGGDRPGCGAPPRGPRLVGVFALAVERFLAVPNPRRAVLRSVPAVQHGPGCGWSRPDSSVELQLQRVEVTQ